LTNNKLKPIYIMARVVKTRKILSDKELAQQQRNTYIKDIRESINLIGQAPNERKIFSIGEEIFTRHGSFICAKIIDIIEEGIYEVEITYNGHIPYTNKTEGKTINRILCWSEIQKISTKECTLVAGNDLRLNFMQQEVGSLIHSYIEHFGMDFNPDYQRDLVWSLEDKQQLIESIINRVDIGKFVFLRNDYSAEKLYEVLDGKQRLTALYEFHTDQFQYKGFYYSELSFTLKHLFESTPVSVAVQDKTRMTKKDIYDYFLRLNTCGKQVDVNHLNKIREEFYKL